MTSSQPSGTPAKRVLDPIDRISEVLFGLIMVLTITCSLSVATTGPTAVREILFGALGCNLAWGIIDAFMYLMARLSERAQDVSALRGLQNSKSVEEANGIITSCLPPLFARIISAAELGILRELLKRMPEPPERPRLT